MSGEIYRLFNVSHETDEPNQPWNISVANDAPLVFQDEEDRVAYDEMHKTTSILRSNWDKHGPKAFDLDPNLRLLGVGAFLWTQQGEDEPVQIVAVKTHGPSKGKLAQPSCLVTTNMVEQCNPLSLLVQNHLMGTLNFAWKKDKTLTMPVLLFSKAGDAISIRDYLGRTRNAEAYSGEDMLKDLVMMRPNKQTVEHNPLDEPYYQAIQLSNDAYQCFNPEAEQALISDSGTNVNVLFSTLTQIPENSELVVFDPEGYEREMKAITRDSMFCNYFAENVSVPMTAHCANVRARPEVLDMKYE